MSDQHSALVTNWATIVADLIARADNNIEPLTRAQRLSLSTVEPIMMMNGYILVAAPDEMTKFVLEEELGPLISEATSRLLGISATLAVTLASAPSSPTAATSPEAAVPNPVPQPGADATAAAPHAAPMPAGETAASPSTTASVPPAGAAATQPGTATPADPGSARYSESWSTEEIPSSLDDLATRTRMDRELPAHDPNREDSLNPKHTFDSFVIGSSNRFANGAAVAVAENPARAYNPLFIWGGSGLGKTHLLHAAGNYAQYLHKGLRVKYVSSEEFTNDYINSLRDDRQESFKRRYRNLDILMVDDIQFLEGKESTQEEFFHTFNALHQANKQIILSSDRPPKQLTTLEDRLRTRFEGGLITDIQPPDLETRIAILMKKAAADNTQVSHEVLEHIASRFDSSIRELEGALIRVSAYSSLINEPISLEMAEIALHDLAPDSSDQVITAAAIIEVTAQYFGLDVDVLISSVKKREIAHARQLAMYLCRELTDLSLPKIGQEFGGRDHSTVMYADRKVRKDMNSNRNTYDEIQALTQQIKSRTRG